MTEVIVHFIVGTPQEQWCDRCLATAELRFPLHAISEAGVAEIGAVIRCINCEPVHDEQR